MKVEFGREYELVCCVGGVYHDCVWEGGNSLALFVTWMGLVGLGWVDIRWPVWLGREIWVIMVGVLGSIGCGKLVYLYLYCMSRQRCGSWSCMIA